MAVPVQWYDLLCYLIIAASAAGSLWTILSSEGGGGRHRDVDRTAYESLLIVHPSAGEPRLEPLWGKAHLVSHQLWTSCWKCLHPGWLLGFRVLALLAMAALLACDIRKYDYSILLSLYYTEWTFTLVIIYFAIATVISAHGCWIYSKQHVKQIEEANTFLKGNPEQNAHSTLTYKANADSIRLQSHHKREIYKKRAGFWGYVMQIVYQTSAGAAILTDVVFWGILVPFLSVQHFSLNVVMGCMHSLNAVFLLIDSALNNLPFPWFRMAYFVLWSCIYVIFQWVLHACGFTWWPYPFLELATHWAPLWYASLALVHIPCYGLYYLIIKAKTSFFPKIFSHAYVTTS